MGTHIMAKKEILTDFWVNDLLKEANINLSPQGSTIKEVNNALKTASKAGTGNVGFPEFCGVVKDFLIVIENKADVSYHIKRNDKELICNDVFSIKNYAVNGALFYGLHLAKNTSYTKIIVIAVSGNEAKHHITPLFINERGEYKELNDVETFTLFSESNIEEYYLKNILKEETPEEKTTAGILKDARELHEDLRNYGSIQDKDKPLIVSGILLALREMEYKGFSIESLTGDEVNTDGEKIYKAIEDNLKRARVSPDVKKDKLLSQFLIIKDTKAINEKNEYLEKTPLRHYTEFLYKNIYKNIKYIHSAEDYLGRFYGEFMSYSGGDGQNLGIVLTPKHITELFCELADLKPTDSILDPCCGTAGFLIAAMHNMLQKTSNKTQQKNIRANQLHGLELQPYMFTIATTNMILRGDGKSNLDQEDFLKQNPAQLQLKGCNKGFMNPPYSMGTKENSSLYEINFTEYLLQSITAGGKVVVIVPQSSMTGKTKEEQSIKANILKYHTLEGVITLNKNTFYGVGTNPCIAVFTVGIPHNKEIIVKFINFENDGFEVQKHRGLVETLEATDKKQHLLDVWFDRIEAETKFCVNTTVEVDDEWLHSFYYFNDEIPTQADFEKTIGDYLTFEFSMIMQGRGYLFDDVSKRVENLKDIKEPKTLDDVKWKDFSIGEIFTSLIRGNNKSLEVIGKGNGHPYIGAKYNNNGVTGFVNTQANNINLFKGNAIVFIMTGEGSVGKALYKSESFIPSNNVYVGYSNHLNKYNAHMIVTMINKQEDKYNYGYIRNDKRLRKEKVLLPVNSKNEPDYEYMEQYIKYLEYQKLSAYLGFKKRTQKN